MLCEMFSSVGLGCLGLCLDGRQPATLGMLLYGWYLRAFCGVLGGK
jgi:hypothetical protein